MTKLDRLQQYLPFTVLKRTTFFNEEALIRGLQQYLPFTVLKLYKLHIHFECQLANSCNSTYRLRY